MIKQKIFNSCNLEFDAFFKYSACFIIQPCIKLFFCGTILTRIFAIRVQV